MSGQQQAPATLYPGKHSVPILQETGWAPGLVWTGGKSRPHRDSIPGCPARSQSLYRLSYPAHTWFRQVSKWQVNLSGYNTIKHIPFAGRKCKAYQIFDWSVTLGSSPNQTLSLNNKRRASGQQHRHFLSTLSTLTRRRVTLNYYILILISYTTQYKVHLHCNYVSFIVVIRVITTVNFGREHHILF